MGSLKKNFIYQGAYQVFKILLPLVTAPYVARVLGKNCSGIYSFTHSIANYFVVFSMLGLEQYGSRCIAKARDNEEEKNRVFSELFVLHALVSLIAIGLYFFYSTAIAPDYQTIFLLQGFWVASSLFDVNWFFFGIEKFRLTVIRSSIIKALTVIATFLFVKTRDDLGIYTFILSFSMLLSQLAVWPMLRGNVKFRKTGFRVLKKHIRPLLILFIAVIAANLNRMIDKVMLGWFDRIAELGCYDYADRIIRMPLSLIAALGTIMLSKMSNLFARKDHRAALSILQYSACIVLLMSFGMGFGIAAIAPEFVIMFLGEEYQETVNLLIILSLSIPLVGWNNYIRTQILIPKEMDMVYTKAVSIGAAVNILTNTVLIHFFGATGAAIATILSYAVILLVQTIRLAGKMKDLAQYSVFPLAAGAAMYAAVRLSARASGNLYLSVCIEVLTGVIIYGGLSLLYLKKRQPVIFRLLGRH